MTRERKILNEAAAELRQKYGYEGDCPTVFAANVGRVFGAFQDYLKESHTDDEITLALNPVKAAIGLFNDEARRQRIEQLAAMSQSDAIKDFMRTQNVLGLAIARDKEGVYSVKDCETVAVEPYDVVKEIFPTEKAGIIDACCIFADNVAKWHFKNDEKTAVNRKGLSADYISLRQRMGWEINVSKCSKSALAKQLTEIVALILPGLDITMINADVTFLETSIIQGKSVSDNAGAYTMRDEKTIVNFVFRAAFTRYNKLPYSFQNGTRAEKTPDSQGANKDMAEAEPVREKPERVVSEKVEIPAASQKKSAGKKTTKAA